LPVASTLVIVKMTDRYARYPRPPSPRIADPYRSSMPTVNYASYGEMHVVPTRREVITTPRSSGDRVHVPGPVTTTTYKIMPEVAPARHSSVRAGSRTRSSTIDSARPTVITTTPRHRPTVHGGAGRPGSPIHNPYRSSDEGDYLAIPSSSGRHRSHRSMYSATVDNGEINRSSRDADRLRVGSGREHAGYTGSRSRTGYSGKIVRHPDTVADDYGSDGYGYTNPRDLVQYDLNHGPRYHRTRDSSETRARPSSMHGYSEVAHRSYDNRERGPPPTTRGFDKIQTRPATFDPPPQARLPVESVGRPRANSRNRPVSVYQEREAPRHYRSEEYYDPRNNETADRKERHSRHDRYADEVDPRSSAPRQEKREPEERFERKRDALAAGLSLAAGALGLNAITNSGSTDQDEKDEHRRRKDDSDEERRRRRDHHDESDEEQRRRRDGREHREESDEERRRRRDREYNAERHAPVDRHHRDDREATDSIRDHRHHRDDKEYVLSNKYDPVRDEREVREEYGEARHRHRGDVPAIATDPREGSPGSEDSQGRPRRERILPPAAFNPRDTMDIRALKDALNAQDTSAEKEAVPVPASRETAFDPRDVHNLRSVQAELSSRDERPRREITPPNGNRELRVVSPPREASRSDEKPVKGILRAPREKFPEDPAPIREGVAPLKDAKKDGVPPDARWTKISRKLVNPEALELGKERYEARDDFVIVLRVLSKEEVQGYAEITQTIRGEYS
jgi:hypothetical protein